MADWIGGDGRTTADTYRAMAETQLAGISPTYEAICLGVADDAEAQRIVERLPRPKRQPNLLLGAVRYLGGPVDTWPAFRAFLLENADGVEQVMLTHATQTNEPHRCATLLPQLATITGPVALLEVGASAGLCLYPDRYGYEFSTEQGSVGLGDGPPVFDCDLDGTAAPERLPVVVWRAGLDLNPLDVTDDDHVRWLESLIWPEQRDRFTTLRQAVRIAREDPPQLVGGDLTTDLAPLAATAPADATLVVFHSAVLAYVPDDARTAFVATVRELAAARPTVWLSNEGRGVLPGTESMDDPGRFVLSRDGVAVARTAPHGRSYTALAPSVAW